MNNVHPTIKFTAKYSKKAVNFLDTTVKKSVTGELSTDVYQKPTDSPALPCKLGQAKLKTLVPHGLNARLG